MIRRGSYGSYLARYDERYDRNMVKFMSVIDGNYVRARLCDGCMPKYRRMMELDRQEVVVTSVT